MSPFRSPNYTNVPNELLDLLPSLNDQELRIMLALCSVNYGTPRPEKPCTIQIRELQKMTGLSYIGVMQGIKGLERRGELGKFMVVPEEIKQ